MDVKQSETILQIINNKKQYLLEASDDILDVLAREENQKIINGIGEFRNRIYPPLKTIYTFIKQVLSSTNHVKMQCQALLQSGCLMVKTRQDLSVNYLYKISGLY